MAGTDPEDGPSGAGVVLRRSPRAGWWVLAAGAVVLAAVAVAVGTAGSRGRGTGSAEPPPTTGPPDAATVPAPVAPPVGAAPVRVVSGAWPSGLVLVGAPAPSGGSAGLRPAYVISGSGTGGVDAERVELPLQEGWWRTPLLRVDDEVVFATLDQRVVRFPIDDPAAWDTIAVAGSVLAAPEPDHVWLLRSGELTDVDVGTGRAGAATDIGRFTDLALGDGVVTTEPDAWAYWRVPGPATGPERRGPLRPGEEVVAAGSGSLFLAEPDGSLKAVDVLTGATAVILPAGPDRWTVGLAALSPDGRRLAVVRRGPSCDAAEIVVVDLGRGSTEVRRPTSHCPARPVWVTAETVAFELARPTAERSLLAVQRLGPDREMAVLEVPGASWWLAAGT